MGTEPAGLTWHRARGGGMRAVPRQESPGVPGRRARRVAAVMAWGPAGIKPAAGRWAASALALAGAALMAASAAIHLDLWATGYQAIAVIGPLFLAQGTASALAAVALAVLRRAGLLVAGAVLMTATACGLLLSAWVGLFGFQESLAVPYAGTSLAVEFTGAGLLLAGAGLILAGGPPPSRRGIPGTTRGIPGTTGKTVDEGDEGTAPDRRGGKHST